MLDLRVLENLLIVVRTRSWDASDFQSSQQLRAGSLARGCFDELAKLQLIGLALSDTREARVAGELLESKDLQKAQE